MKFVRELKKLDNGAVAVAGNVCVNYFRKNQRNKTKAFSRKRRLTNTFLNKVPFAAKSKTE